MDLPVCLPLTRIFAKVPALKFDFDGTQDLFAMTQRQYWGKILKELSRKDATSLKNASMENKYFHT